MWIDTHCHLDASEFDADRLEVVARARAAGVTMMVIPSTHPHAFVKSRHIAHQFGGAYALGVHPLWARQVSDEAVDQLKEALSAAINDPRLVAVGEIGLDFYEADIEIARQQWLYQAQIKLAKEFDLPVLLHVRRSADALLKHVRRIEVSGGIVHAFNGSEQQAQALIARGFCLGFGGAMTYAGSKRIRRLAAMVPDDGWVLETDAPDMPPEWLRHGRQGPDGKAAFSMTTRNEPCALPAIAQVFAQLRQTDCGALARSHRDNVCRVLPRLARLLDTH